MNCKPANTSFSPGVHASTSLSIRLGEDFINLQSTAFDTRFKFTGKEKDSEIERSEDSQTPLKDKREREQTGYSYFGARYYDSEVSVWLSVDPLSDEYPSTSPFMYVLGMPTALIDPNGMNAWIPPTEGSSTWTAQTGDSPGSLARDAGISQSQAEAVMRNYNSSNGNNRSSDIMVYEGDQVTLQGAGSVENNSASTGESAAPSNYNITPSAGTAESVSVIGVLGDLALDVVEYGLQELGMSERAAENTTNAAALGMMLITKKPRFKGTNLKNSSSLSKSLSYDRPKNYIPGPVYPTSGGGGNNWIWWAAGTGLSGGTAYFRIKYQHSLLDAKPLIQPLPQDNTILQPIIRPYYGR